MEGIPQPSHTAEVNDVGRYPIEERFTIIVVVSQVPETLVQDAEWTGTLVDVQGAIASMVERVRKHLEEDRQEAREYGEPCSTESAYQRCLQVAREIAPVVLFAPVTKLVAFTEDSGGVSLVLDGTVTDRRIDFRISPDGETITPICVDGAQARRGAALSHIDRQRIRELAEWVAKGQ